MNLKTSLGVLCDGTLKNEAAGQTAQNSLLESFGLVLDLERLLGALLADLDGLGLGVVDELNRLVAALFAVFKHEKAILQELLHLAVAPSLICLGKLLELCLLLGGDVEPVLRERLEDLCGLGVSSHCLLFGTELVLDVS